MPVYMLLLEYDGSDFHGWQVQPGFRTVQGEIVGCLKNYLRGEFRLIGASRTDSGVHAEGQVASLHTEEEISSRELRSFLNAQLGRDIYVKELKRVADDFHARFSAKSKVYRYRVLLGRSPIRRRFVYEFMYNLDEEKLDEMSKLIVGIHDFSALSVGKSGGLVKVIRANWKKKGDEYHFTIEANRFLYKMVRSLVGLQLRIASGRESIETLKRALEDGVRPRLYIAPPQGLTLLKVKYPRRFEAS